VKQDEGITFVALFSKATTTVDGGWSITFEVGQDEAIKVVQLAEFRGQALQVAVIPFETLQTRDRFKFPKL
jgi:hypothetical protein